MLTLTFALYPPYNTDCLERGIRDAIAQVVTQYYSWPAGRLTLSVPVMSDLSATPYPFQLTLELPMDCWPETDTSDLARDVAIKSVAAIYLQHAGNLAVALEPVVPYRLPWRLIVVGEGIGEWYSDAHS